MYVLWRRLPDRYIFAEKGERKHDSYTSGSGVAWSYERLEAHENWPDAEQRLKELRQEEADRSSV